MQNHPGSSDEESLEIIAKESGPHSFSANQFEVVKRVVQATADFDFVKNMVFHPVAVEAGMAAIRAGADIVTDIQMVAVGISKDRLAKRGGSVWCFVTDDDVLKTAKELSLPREIAAMRKAAEVCEGAIYVIGNTPAALLELIRLVREGKAKPSLIVGVPVGFVSAAESKEQLLANSTPFITCRGRKGGSAVAVSVINALSFLAV